MNMIEGYYTALTGVFSPVIAISPMVTIMAVALMVTFAITIVTRFMVDQKKMQELKDKQKEIQNEVKALQKENKTEEANERMKDMFKYSNQLMKMNFKVFPVTMILVLAILPWLAQMFEGPVVVLPMALPYFGAEIGWLGWYFLLSITFSQFFRKMMGVQ